jgi:hypothetical protein
MVGNTGMEESEKWKTTGLETIGMKILHRLEHRKQDLSTIMFSLKKCRQAHGFTKLHIWGTVIWPCTWVPSSDNEHHRFSDWVTCPLVLQHSCCLGHTRRKQKPELWADVLFPTKSSLRHSIPKERNFQFLRSKRSCRLPFLRFQFLQFSFEVPLIQTGPN